MTEIPFLIGELIFAGAWIAGRAAVFLCGKKLDIKRELLLLLIYVNYAVVIRFTFFPMELADGHVQPLLFEPDKFFPPRVNIVPFVHMFESDSTKHMLLNVIGNLTMFIPSGIALPICFKRLDSFGNVVLAGFLSSLCIEILQLPFAVRCSDVDDLILNTAGCAVGYGIYALFHWKKKKQ